MSEAKRSALDAKQKLPRTWSRQLCETELGKDGRGPDRSARLSSAKTDDTPGAKRSAPCAMTRGHVLGLAELVHLHQM